ncbi:eukaryotic translation initiation factor 3 subunit A-like [Podarcis raffonei]|uniref:eukaryotic translation initiation factor 3 subunit A-like n=1 Tax=Podarcis raffonei TaxID=65483 RepID=UPI002329980C|nr:eukaryotic translation initiation factor 3 subunit A-like [Podarcis raffonei]
MADSFKAKKLPKGKRRSPEPHAYDPWGWGDAEWDWELPPPRVCWESERAPRAPVETAPRGRGGRGRDSWGGGSPPKEEEEESWRGRGRDPWGGGSPPKEEEEEPWRERGPRRGGRGWDPWEGRSPPNEEAEEEPPQHEEEEDPFSRRSRWGSREREPPSWEQPPPAKAPRKSHWGGSPTREAGTRVLLTPPRQSSPEQGPPHRPRGRGEWDSARHGVRSPGSPPRGGSWWGEAERRHGESPGREERGRGRQAEEGPRDEAPWGGSEHGGVLGSLERLAWEQGGDQWRNPDWVKDQPATLTRGGSPARSNWQHSQSGDPDGWGSSASFQSGWAADGTEEGTPEMEEELGWDAAGEDGMPAGSDGAHPTPQKWTPCQEVVDYWTRACRTCLSLRQRRRLMSFCPRPTLPDRSHETPALNADIASLGVAPHQRADLVDAQKLGWLQDEVLDTLAPAMSVYEMAEEALEKRAPVDPLELRECAQRLLRLLGSLSARLTLHRRVKALRAINPRLQSICSKMTSRNCNGMLFGEDKVQLLKELVARFPQLTQNNTTYKRTRTQRRRSKVYSGQPPQGAGTQGGGMLCFKEEFQQTDTVSQGIWAGTDSSLPETQQDHALNWSDFGS